MSTIDLVPSMNVAGENAMGTENAWVYTGGVHWYYPALTDVREVAAAMNAVAARFITITATQLPGNTGFRLEYLWDIDGQLLGFPFHVSDNSIASIYDLCEAADWIEREIHEGFAIDFPGREYTPLELRPGDKLGVNLREEGK